jgi:hypothetical protein
VEAVARDVAASHYAKRLGLRVDDVHVQRNVERNHKQVGVPTVRLVLSLLAAHGCRVVGPDGEDVR